MPVGSSGTESGMKWPDTIDATPIIARRLQTGARGLSPGWAHPVVLRHNAPPALWAACRRTATLTTPSLQGLGSRLRMPPPPHHPTTAPRIRHRAAGEPAPCARSSQGARGGSEVQVC